jgi:hypothetical protein
MATLARHQDEELQRNARTQGVNLTLADARTLRRAQLTLRSWGEEVCNGTIQRPWADDGRSDPCRPSYTPINSPGRGKQHGWIGVPDRERGALRRIDAVCKTYGASYYHQSDPRGAALYISADKLTDTNYAQAICCAV